MKLKFGSRHLIDHYLIRKETWNVGIQAFEKRWEKKQFGRKGNHELKEAIFLGDRTLSNGIRFRDNTYTAKEHLTVQLFCYDPNRNPVYAIVVPLE